MAVYIIMTIISMLFAGYAQNVKEVDVYKRQEYQKSGLQRTDRALFPYGCQCKYRHG